MTASSINTSTGISRKGAFEKRIHEIDFLRGVLMILVLIDHLFNRFYIDNTFSSALQAAGQWYWTCQARQVIRFFALGGFCLLSGISCQFSRNNWVRAGEMLVLGGVLAVGSNILDSWKFMGEMRIDFNVIFVLAWCTLFYCFVQNKSWKAILAMGLFSFLMCWYVVPWLYKVNQANNFHAYVPALWEPDISQADWLPLFPFMTWFFAGALFSYFRYSNKKSLIPSWKRNWERPVCFVGRHSLIFYVLHQVVYIPLFLLLNTLFGA